LSSAVADARLSEGFLQRRHPGDVLRLVLAACVLSLSAQAIDSNEVGRLEVNLFRLINEFPVPTFLYPALWLVMQLGSLGAIPATALAAAFTRRWRLAFDFVVAGGTIYVVAQFVKRAADRGRPSALLDGVSVVGEPASGLGYVSGHSAVAVALATVAAPYLGRRGRRIAWLLAIMVCLARVYTGAHLPWDVIGGAALGWMAGATAHLVLGAPEGHPTPEWLSKAMKAWGWAPQELRRAGPPTRRSASFFVRDQERGDLFAKVVSRERRDDDFLYRAWQLIRNHRVVHEPDFGSPLRQVEHEALMALLARANGVRVPDVVMVESSGNGAAVLVQEWVPGRSLRELADDGLDRLVLGDLVAQLGRLRDARILHGELDANNVVVDREGRVWITNFAEADRAPNEEELDREGSRLLESLADSFDNAAPAWGSVRLGEDDRGGERDPF
jgi:membrane-associated phospholipid phosphatase